MVEYEDYESDVEPEIEDVDVKIKPDFYIHKALIKAQDCLTKDDVRSGFMQFIMVEMHIRALCVAAKKLPNDWESKVDKLCENLKKDTDDLSIKVSRAQIELGYIMERIFESSLTTEPLIDRKRKTDKNLP